jgi:GntR family transcriptional regulator, transcriptional repressor for pyruvate dehydrogenase complex
MFLESLSPRPNLASDAARILERSIRDGSLAPGDRLPSETEIAKRLGVSRPVVREAIAYLRADGVVESRRGLGLFVSSQDTLHLRTAEMEASPQAIMEFLEFRLGIEIETARLAAKRRTPQELLHIEAAFEEMRRLDAETKNSAEADLMFHAAIAQAAHNDLYRRIFQFLSKPLLNSIRSMRAREGTSRAPVDLRLRDHALILEGIRTRNPENASKAMRQHLGQTYVRYEELDEPGKNVELKNPA